jgi:predicted O-methyltransferase YrrM
MMSTAEANNGRSAQARDFAESFVPEDEAAKIARSMAAEVGLTPVSPGTGAMLCLLASAGSARAVIEIGTGTGVSALWLLRGMRPDGVLTTIDVEGEHQRIARRIFQEAGHPPGRTRVITGRAADVLPRLADRAYDLLFVDGDRADYAVAAAAAPRLLRPGGVMAINGTLAGGRVADSTARDPQTVALRELAKAIRDDDEWTSALIPVGDGLLCGVRR